MDASQSWVDLENRRAEWLDALFRMQTGLDVDPSEIERYARDARSHAERLTPPWRDHPDAWSLLSNILEEAELTAIGLEIRRLCDQHYTFDDILLDGQPVTLYSLDRYLRLEDSPEKRHEVLVRVACGHPEVDQALERYNARRRELAAEWNYTPIDNFLASEGLDLVQLRKLLTELASAMRPAFESSFAENREVVLGNNQGEPWEDFTALYMNRWSAYVDRFVPTIDAPNAALGTANALGFDTNAIAMDLEDRPRKIPGASAWDIRIPEDVRICVKPIEGAENLTAIYHEMGHALHFVSVDPNLPFYVRAGFHCGTAETFSFWMESLVSDPIYLKELGLGERASAELVRFGRLVRSTFSTWLSVQALTIIDYWTQGPFALEEIGGRLGHYMKQFMGLSVPAKAVRVLPTFVRTLGMNTVGYPLAYARLGHLLRQLEAIQRDWWHSTAASDNVRAYMRGGRKAGFPASMLDVGPFVQRYVDDKS